MLRCGGCATRSVPDLELSAVSATTFARIVSYVLREAMNCNTVGGQRLDLRSDRMGMTPISIMQLSE